MQEQEIINGNKLIAEFMGYKYFEDLSINRSWFENGTNMLFPLQLEYNRSWDWLMPVVEKIEKDYWVTTTTSRGISIVSIHQPKSLYEEIVRFDSKDKLKVTWKAVVEFIKWYNSCQK